MSRPLDGLRVLDFTRVYSGPYATLLLSDLGAEVVKVEHPQYGDDSRSFGPFVGGTSTYFETLNRGKKSIAVDYRVEPGQAALRQLAHEFDVVVENFRPGRMAAYGLDYDTLSRLNPRLVYVSISGYGQDSASPGCYDIVAQAVSGLMSLTGLPELPFKTGPAIADAISGLTAAVGLLSALYRRERTGQGGYVDVAMADAVFATLEHTLAAYSVTGTVPRRQGNVDHAIAPFDCFEAADGWVVIAAGSNRIWQRLVALVGPALDQPAFASNSGRVEHYDSLRPLLAAWCATQPGDTLLDRLHEANIPAGAVRTIDELAADARLEARDMLLKLALESGEAVLVPGSPIHVSGAERPPAQRAPRLGEHTALILTQAGLAQV